MPKVFKNFVELENELRTLPQSERLECVKENQSVIISDDILNIIIELLEDNLPFEFVDTLQSSVKGFASSALEKLNPTLRFTFAKKHQDKILSGNTVAKILKTFTQESEQIEFIQDPVVQKKIENQAHVGHVLENIPKRIRFAFMKQHIEKIIEFEYFIRAIEALPDETTRFTIFNTFPHFLSLIRHGIDLKRVLYFLPEAHRVNVAIQHQKKIKSTAEYYDVWSVMPNDEQLEFALNMPKVNEIDKLASLYLLIRMGNILGARAAGKTEVSRFALILLPDHIRLQFIKKLQEQVTDAGTLTDIIGLLALSLRFDFVTPLADLIKTANQVAKILEQLPIEKRLYIAKIKVGLIHDQDDLESITRLLDENEEFIQFYAEYQKASSISAVNNDPRFFAVKSSNSMELNTKKEENQCVIF